MAREVELGPILPEAKKPDRRLASSTARAFAAAVSIIVVSTTVIDRSTDAIVAHDLAAAGAHTYKLEVGDEGPVDSVIDLGPMGPEEATQLCFQLSYAGNADDPKLELSSRTASEHDQLIQTEVTTGVLGANGSCDEFVPGRLAFSGTMASLAQATESMPLIVGRTRLDQSTVWVKVSFTTQDLGEVGTVTPEANLAWQVSSR